jgi:hypothetical protein
LEWKKPVEKARVLNLLEKALGSDDVAPQKFILHLKKFITCN